MEEDSLCSPFLDWASGILSHSAQCMSNIFVKTSNAFSKLPNAGLYFCGFSLFLVPIIVIYWTIVISILMIECIILATFRLVIGLFFLLVGIWPSVIIVLGNTAISIIWLPWNIYYHCMVTYRTVLLRRNLKLLSFILLPITHLLIPPTMLLISSIFLIPWCAAVSFAGFPSKPWKNIQPCLANVWHKFSTDMDTFYRNYGHHSGIPLDWNGRVYGLPLDPLVIIISIFLYIFTVIPITFAVFAIITIKAITIFLEVLKQSWKSFSVTKFLNWYMEIIEEYAEHYQELCSLCDQS